MKRFAILPILLLAGPAGHAQAPQAPKFKPPAVGDLLPLLDGANPDSLEGPLRDVLIKSLPTPLYESSPGWGRTTTVSEVRWRVKDGLLRPETVKRPRNDGTWKKVRFEAINPADSLVLDVRDAR